MAGVGLFLLALGAAILYGVQPRGAWLEAVPAMAVPNSAGVAPDLFAEPVSDVERPVYPYSVIAAGAHSVGELTQAISSDPVVAAHYANFDVTRTRVERLARPRIAHVSYRIGNDVFWTRKPLVLPAGEQVLTDGVHMARSRCGNQVGDLPGETSPSEPVAGAMDVPMVTAAPTRSAAAFLESPVRAWAAAPLPPAQVVATNGFVPGGIVPSGGTTGPGGLASDIGGTQPTDLTPFVDPQPPAPAGPDGAPPSEATPGQPPTGPRGDVPKPGGEPTPPAPPVVPPAATLPPSAPPVVPPAVVWPPVDLTLPELPPLNAPPTITTPDAPLVPPDVKLAPLPPIDEVPPPMTPVPEPGTALMMMLAGAVYGVRRLSGRAGSAVALPGTPRVP